MSVSEQKKLLREKIRGIGRNFNSEQKRKCSELIIKRIEQLESFNNAKVIMAYWPLQDEVQIQDFVSKWSQEKTMLLPVIQGDTLTAKQFKGSQFMNKTMPYGIFEPIGNSYENLKGIEFIIVPGVAFDRAGNRLGRGKGYYDNFLHNLQALKIGVCFNYQFVNDIPAEEMDIPVDDVFTA